MARRWGLIAFGVVLLSGFYLGSTLLVRKYWVQSFHIPSAAMTPTLLPGDYFLVDKRAFILREPRRGEVVAFDSDGEIFVSRIVGMPGDRVAVRDGALALNGETVAEEPVADRFDYMGKRLAVARESLDGFHFRVARAPGHDERGLEETVVEPAHYLMLGDFRNNALDSRYRGTVDRTKLLGPVTLIYFSKDPKGGGVRWDRVGTSVDAAH